MIDSNECVTYENGRQSGYEEGYSDGLSVNVDLIVEKLKRLEQYEKLGTIEELSKRINEEDVLKFYYDESNDRYLVGQRVDRMYYAEVLEYPNEFSLNFIMSRYLPWGQHIVDPDTAWEEFTYPDEPKEITFTEWLNGFLKQKRNIYSKKYIENLKTCIHETDHEDADILVCEFLEDIGYSELADEYRKVPKWFS